MSLSGNGAKASPRSAANPKAWSKTETSDSSLTSAVYSLMASEACSEGSVSLVTLKGALAIEKSQVGAVRSKHRGRSSYATLHEIDS